MAKFGVIIGILIVAVLVVTCQRHGDVNARKDIELVLDSLQIRLDQVERRLALERWREATRGDADSLAFFQQLHRVVTGDSSVFATLRNGRGAFAKDVDRRRHDVLYPIILASYVDNERAIAPLYDSLTAYLKSRWCILDNRTWATHEMQSLLNRAVKPADRERMYRALTTPDTAGIDLMSRLFRMRDQSAKRQGYNDYFSLVVNTTGSSVGEYDDLFRAVDTITRGAFDSVRALTQLRQGSVPLEIWNWSVDVRRFLDTLDQRCPADSQLSMAKATLAGMGFNVDRLPIYIQTALDSTQPAGADVLIVSVPGDIRVVANLRNGHRSLRLLVAALGRAVALAETGDEFASFARYGDPVWTGAMAHVFERLCLDPQWLGAYAHLPESLAVLTSHACHAVDLMETRLLLVDGRFEREAYTSLTGNPGTIYWDIFTNITGLPRHDELFPWAADLAFVERPLGQRAEMLSRIIAAQTLNYLERRYGRVIGNPDIRTFLVENYFRFGSRYDWRDLLERGTGERLSPAALVDSVALTSVPISAK